MKISQIIKKFLNIFFFKNYKKKKKKNDNKKKYDIDIKKKEIENHTKNHNLDIKRQEMEANIRNVNLDIKNNENEGNDYNLDVKKKEIEENTKNIKLNKKKIIYKSLSQNFIPSLIKYNNIKILKFPKICPKNGEKIYKGGFLKKKNLLIKTNSQLNVFSNNKDLKTFFSLKKKILPLKGISKFTHYTNNINNNIKIICFYHDS